MGIYRGSKRAILIRQENTDTLMVVSRNPRHSPVRRPASIDPEIKAWIDNVIAPVPVDQWFPREDSR
jgi:hypothetical protein